MNTQNTQFLLFEIGTEEIPSSFIPRAVSELARIAEDAFAQHHLSWQDITTFSTPRRMTLSVQGLATVQPDRDEKLMGPPAKIAFLPDGSPGKAAIGFARSNGVDVSALSVEETDKGSYVALHRHIPGRQTKEILKDLLPELILRLQFPKNMIWNETKLRFPRPIRWIVAILGDEVISFELAGITSSDTSFGHRFMSPEPVKLTSSRQDYLDAMQKAFVMADPESRRQKLLDEARNAAKAVGGRLVEDEELALTNTNLNEFPSAMCGSFDQAFLAVPKEVLITSMKEHQKYFAVEDETGNLLPFFIGIVNTISPKPELVKNGLERVLRARLSDAAFFFKEDCDKSFSDFAERLKGVVFHQKLGSIWDKAVRVQKIAAFLADRLAPDAKATVERAAFLCKADLTTSMVGEFPTLQGIMGRHYSLLSGESQAVSDAILEHYMPVRAGAALPSTTAGAIVSLADKLDNIAAFFALGLQPTGGTDPYGLRRQCLGILHIISDKDYRLSIKDAFEFAGSLLPETVSAKLSIEDIIEFCLRRYSIDMTSKGFSADVIEAATRCGFDDIIDCTKRIEAISSMRTQPAFEPLSIAFKRIMNILKGFEGDSPNPTLLSEEAEKNLYNAYSAISSEVDSLIQAQRYEQALLKLLGLKEPVDAFFDNVMVMSDNNAIKHNRLSLLWVIARIFLEIGDLSAISA